MYPWKRRTSCPSLGVRVRICSAETARSASIKHGFWKANVGTWICHALSVSALLLAASVLDVSVV